MVCSCEHGWSGSSCELPIPYSAGLPRYGEFANHSMTVVLPGTARVDLHRFVDDLTAMAGYSFTVFDVTYLMTNPELRSEGVKVHFGATELSDCSEPLGSDPSDCLDGPTQRAVDPPDAAVVYEQLQQAMASSDGFLAGLKVSGSNVRIPGGAECSAAR